MRIWCLWAKDPGADEDEKGLPFIGRAGKKLTEIIEKGMGLEPGKRTPISAISSNADHRATEIPERDEIEACEPFLVKQLGAIQPKVIVALGKPASSTLLGRTCADHQGARNLAGICRHPIDADVSPGSYLIRFYTKSKTGSAVQDDMKKFLEILEKMKPSSRRNP